MRDLFNLVDACSSKITFTHMYVICYWQLISFDDIITNAKTIKSYSWFARHDGPFYLIFFFAFVVVVSFYAGGRAKRKPLQNISIIEKSIQNVNEWTKRDHQGFEGKCPQKWPIRLDCSHKMKWKFILFYENLLFGFISFLFFWNFFLSSFALGFFFFHYTKKLLWI